MPADRDVVEDRQQPVGEDVHDRVADQDDQEQQEVLVQDRGRVGGGEVDAEHVQPVEGEDRLEEERRAVADAGDDPDEADDVEPAGDPAPAGAAELGRPPVGAARGRERGRQLRHRERDQQHEGAQDRPADRDRDRPAGVPREPEVREAPGQNRDDRERDREVGEAAPAAVELLLVAEVGELALVLAHLAGRGRAVLAAHPPRMTSPGLGHA